MFNVKVVPTLTLVTVGADIRGANGDTYDMDSVGAAGEVLDWWRSPGNRSVWMFEKDREAIGYQHRHLVKVITGTRIAYDDAYVVLAESPGGRLYLLDPDNPDPAVLLRGLEVIASAGKFGQYAAELISGDRTLSEQGQAVRLDDVPGLEHVAHGHVDGRVTVVFGLDGRTPVAGRAAREFIGARRVAEQVPRGGAAETQG